MKTIVSRNFHHFHNLIGMEPGDYLAENDLTVLTVAVHRQGYVFVRIDAGRGPWVISINRNVKIDDLAAFMLTMRNINDRLGEYK